MKARAEPMVASKSFASLRLRPIHAKNRSTTQRRCRASRFDRERGAARRQCHRVGLPAKQMEFAHAIAPGATRVGLLTNLQDPKTPPQRQELVIAARALELTVVEADVNRPEEIEGAVEALASQRVDIVIVLQTTLLLSFSRSIAELALAKRLPTVYGYREHVLAGGLMSYGVDVPWCVRRSAYFVDKILRGTPPGDLPVEFPTKMLLSINLKTAKALGLTVPPTLLGRADDVIE
jgi:ABC-type uncharacterized transport system substrate-binding protein